MKQRRNIATAASVLASTPRARPSRSGPVGGEHVRCGAGRVCRVLAGFKRRGQTQADALLPHLPSGLHLRVAPTEPRLPSLLPHSAHTGRRRGEGEAAAVGVQLQHAHTRGLTTKGRSGHYRKPMIC
ncbi:hypothetical protein PR202_gb00553 [Eleusine coracana subsp. coracana]|uniref:Uncharacterized protein n=1 Tax=Eleusine coracana subsp. coracana TaxID=191504 RepID=A0AAV5DTP8_ELECO|nr:hypothetical protein PR202_gb00553 [Eleusine coracana subsp. coracana]